MLVLQRDLLVDDVSRDGGLFPKSMQVKLANGEPKNLGNGSCSSPRVSRPSAKAKESECQRSACRVIFVSTNLPRMHRHPFFRFLLLLLLLLVRSPGFAETKSPIQERADRFLKLAKAGYQALFRVYSDGQWLAVTDVTPEHDAAAEATAKAYAAFNGNPAIISEARDLLTHQKELNELTIRQLKQLLLKAAEGPMPNA